MFRATSGWIVRWRSKCCRRGWPAIPRCANASSARPRAVAALTHPGIVSIFEMAIVEDRVCLVLELLEGESLRVRLDRGALTRRQAVDVARQMAEALEAAHDTVPEIAMVGKTERELTRCAHPI